MPILETLNLLGCQNLEEVHPSLGHCKMLSYLSLRDCAKLKKLPKFVCMESLETLNLLECTSLQEFPEICGDIRRLSILHVGSPLIRSLPPSLSGLRDFALTDCGVLESISDAIGNLEYLHISGCNKLATLPNSLFESDQWKYLEIYQCSGLVELRISPRVQIFFVELVLEGCENLKKLPSSIQMESLQHLKISNSPKLDTFPEINGDMHRLNKLFLNYTGIRELPSSIGNLSGLSWLKLEGCEDLRLQKLEKLPENIGDLQELETLDASITAISQPPPSITKLGKLCKLSFSHDEQQFQHSSSFILHQVSGLSSLTSLDLSNHNILGGLPEDLGSLHFLEELNVSGSNISCLPKSINKLLNLVVLNVQFCQNLNELPGELPPNLRELVTDYHLASESIRDLIIMCLKLHMLIISWCSHEKSECRIVSSEQVNVLKLLEHFLRTCIQCDFHQRDYFRISFPEVKILELFDYQSINQKEMSIDLNPSWCTDKFMGFWICYCPIVAIVEATLICKSDPERKHSLNYDIPVCPWFKYPFVCCTYIPFETLWHASGNKQGKNPSDYYLLEVSTRYEKGLCWGIRLEYEKEATSDAKSLVAVRAGKGKSLVESLHSICDSH